MWNVSFAFDLTAIIKYKIYHDALIVESSKSLSLGIHVILTLIICYYGQFQKQNYTNNQIYGVNKVQQHQITMLCNHIKN